MRNVVMLKKKIRKGKKIQTNNKERSLLTAIALNQFISFAILVRLFTNVQQQSPVELNRNLHFTSCFITRLSIAIIYEHSRCWRLTVHRFCLLFFLLLFFIQRESSSISQKHYSAISQYSFFIIIIISRQVIHLFPLPSSVVDMRSSVERKRMKHIQVCIAK